MLMKDVSRITPRVRGEHPFVQAGLPAEMRTHLFKIEDYPAHLEVCWKEHLNPKGKSAPTVISLFAGCGGSSLGYSMAGYRELLAVGWDDHTAETFKANFPDVPVFHGDIAELSVEEALRITGLSR
jgi:predicted RNA methylase